MSVGLYIHVPFCLAKCYYCDFYSVPVGESPVAVESYLDALETEACIYRGLDEVSSVYIGGGTPSCLHPSSLRRLLNVIGSFCLQPRAEFTCEANPRTLTEEKLAVLRDGGVNRLSIGLQSVYNHHLQAMGRIHTVEDFYRSWLKARQAGFINLGVDLIYGLPGMTADEWENSLKLVATLRPQHISTYNLTLEKGTPLENWFQRGLLPPRPGEDMELEQFNSADRLLVDQGYLHYEVANFAVPGWECRHNLNCWRRQEYIGLGPSASGFLKGERYTNVPCLKNYCDSLARGDPPPAYRERLNDEGAMGEAIMLGLRMLEEGIDPDRFYRQFGMLPRQVYGETIDRLIGQGLLQETLTGRLLLTWKGVTLADSVAQEFLSAKLDKGL